MSSVRRPELAEFLRNRRARLRPADVGLPAKQGSLINGFRIARVPSKHFADA